MVCLDAADLPPPTAAFPERLLAPIQPPAVLRKREAAGTHLDEGLDLASSSKSLGTHRLVDRQRGSLNTSNDGVGVRSLLGSVIVLLDDDNLLSSLSTRENDGDLRRGGKPGMGVRMGGRYRVERWDRADQVRAQATERREAERC